MDKSDNRPRLKSGFTQVHYILFCSNKQLEDIKLKKLLAELELNRKILNDMVDKECSKEEILKQSQRSDKLIVAVLRKEKEIKKRKDN